MRYGSNRFKPTVWQGAGRVRLAWERRTATLQRARRLLARLGSAERGLAAVEYAMLLAMIAGGIVMGAEFLGGAVSDRMGEVAAWIGDGGLVGDDCGNDGGGGGTGGEGGTGEGGANTC